MRRVSALALAGLVLAGCGSGGRAEDTTTTEPATTTVGPVSTTAGGPTVHPGLASHVELAVSDLSGRLGVPISQIEVISAQPVVWPDASLGCPEPGQFYTQALVEGYQIGLKHDDRFFDYHGADGDDPFLCASDDKDGGYGFLPPPGSDVER